VGIIQELLRCGMPAACPSSPLLEQEQGFIADCGIWMACTLVVKVRRRV
jgi:hypothetical protein